MSRISSLTPSVLDPAWGNTRSKLIDLADQGLGISLNLLLFSLPMAYITAVRELSLGLAVFFWVAIMVLRKKVLWPKTPVDLPYLIWVSMAFLSLLTATNPGYSFKEIQGEVLKGGLLFYLVYYAFSEKSGPRSAQMGFILIAGNCAMVLFGFWDFFRLGGSLSDYTIRAGSFHYVYGAYGTYLIMVFPFLFFAGLSPAYRKIRWLLWALVLMNIVSLFITFGRAMWVAAALEGIVIGLLLRKKKILLGIALFLVVLFLLIPKSVWFHGENVSEPQDRASQEIGGTAGDLLEVWKLMGAFVQERPFQGIGYGRQSFSETFTEFRARHQPLLWHAHNIFLDITFQTGLQGFLAFVWLLASIFVILFRKGRAGPDNRVDLIRLAAMTMMVGFAVRNFFDSYYVDDSALLFWYLLGAALAIKEEDQTA